MKVAEAAAAAEQVRAAPPLGSGAAHGLSLISSLGAPSVPASDADKQPPASLQQAPSRAAAESEGAVPAALADTEDAAEVYASATAAAVRDVVSNMLAAIDPAASADGTSVATLDASIIALGSDTSNAADVAQLPTAQPQRPNAQTGHRSEGTAADCADVAAQLQAAVAALAAEELAVAAAAVHATKAPLRQPAPGERDGPEGRPLGRSLCGRRADGALQWQLPLSQGRELHLLKDAMDYWGLHQEQQVHKLSGRSLL